MSKIKTANCPLAVAEYLKIKNHLFGIERVVEYESPSPYILYKTNNSGKIKTHHIFKCEFLAMTEYFDALGIHVDAAPSRFDTFFTTRVFEKQTVAYWLACEGWLKYGDPLGISRSSKFKHFPTRREALEAGIQKAFEIREEQIRPAK